MRPDLRLDYAIFQLTPTRTRCELYVSVGGRMVKLAAGLVKPFVSHLQVLEDQMANGGYSIRLEPPDPSLASWFTTGTMERFVRFVSTPEVLERVSTVEKELMQLEATKNNCAEESTPVDEKSVKNALVVYTPGVNMAAPVTSPSLDKPLLMKTRQDSLEATEKEDGENGRKRLFRALDARQAMLQKEQGMTFARAAAAGFTIDNMADLVVFAECFGASRLRDACLKFIELCKKRQEAGLWQEDMELIAAESALARGDMNDGGDHRGDNAGIDLLQRQGSLDSSVDPSNLPSKATGEEGFSTAPPTQRYPDGFHHLGEQGPYGMAWQDQGMHGHPHAMHGVMPPYMQQGYGYGDVRRAPHFSQPQYYGQPGNAPRWWGSDAHSMPPPPYFPPPHQQRYYGDMPHPEAYGDYLHSMQSSGMNGEFPYKLPTNAVSESQPVPSPRKEEISSESVDSMNSSSAKPGSIEASTQVKDKSRSEDVNSTFDHTNLSPGEPVGSRRSPRRSPSPRRSSSPMRRNHLGRSGHRKSGMVVIRNINYIAPSQVQEKETRGESSDSWSEEDDSAIASGDGDSSQSEAGNVRTRVQDVIGLFENPSKSLHSKKKSSSKRGSRKESSKNGTSGDQKGTNINGTNTSVADCEKEDEHMPVGVDEVACLRGSNSNKDMAFVVDKRQSPSSQVDRTLDFDSETCSYKQNMVTEEDPLVLGFVGGEVKTSSQKSQTLCLSDLEANNLPHGITDEVLLFSEKNEIRMKPTTFSSPEVIAEQEGAGSIPKPTGDDFFVVSKATDSVSRNDMGSRLADFDPEVMIGASCNDGLKKMNRGLPDDSFIFSSRNTELEQGTAVRRTDVMIEAELSGNGNTNQNSENAIASDEKALEFFEPDDLYMIPDRHFVRDSIDNSRSAVVDYDFQMLMNMAENETSSLDQDNENAPILEEEDKDMDENVDVPGKGGDMKKSEKEAKVSATRNALEKKKTDVTRNSRNGKLSPLAEAQARAEKLRAYKARLQKSKKEKEEEERNRIEQLKIQRKERIAARTVSTTPTNIQVSSATNSPRGVKPQAIVSTKSNSTSSRRSSLERLTGNSNNRIKTTTVSSSPSAKTVQGLHANGNGSAHSAKVQKSTKTSENLLLKSASSLTENGKEIGRSSSLRGSTGSLKVSKQGGVANHSKSMTEASTLRRQSLPEALTGKVLKGESFGTDSKQLKTPEKATEFSSVQKVPKSNGSTVVMLESKLEEATKKEEGQRITLEYVPPSPLESTSDCFSTEISLPTEMSPKKGDEETKMEPEREFEVTERVFASGISEYKDDQAPLALVSEPKIDHSVVLTSQPSVTNDISLVEVENKEETQCSPVILTSKPQPSISIKEESEPISFLSTPKDAKYLVEPLNSDLVHVAEKYQAPIARASDPSLDFSPLDNGSLPVLVVDSANKNMVSDRSGNLISAKTDSMDSSMTQSGKKSEISEKSTKEKTHAKGFRRLLKFGRKSKSGVSSSSSTSEDDVGAELMTETSLESPEDVSSRVLTSIDEDSPVTFPTSKHHDQNAQNTAVGSKGGNGVATLSQMISQDEHSQPKGVHSFFSLTGFRSKGSESKSR